MTKDLLSTPHRLNQEALDSIISLAKGMPVAQGETDLAIKKIGKC